MYYYGQFYYSISIDSSIINSIYIYIYNRERERDTYTHMICMYVFSVMRVVYYRCAPVRLPQAAARCALLRRIPAGAVV